MHFNKAISNNLSLNHTHKLTLYKTEGKLEYISFNNNFTKAC